MIGTHSERDKQRERKRPEGSTGERVNNGFLLGKQQSPSLPPPSLPSPVSSADSTDRGAAIFPQAFRSLATMRARERKREMGEGGGEEVSEFPLRSLMTTSGFARERKGKTDKEINIQNGF